MNVLPIDLTAVIAIVMGSLIFLIPVAGLTARFALKPVVDAIARAREGQSAKATVELLERRLDLMEHQVQQMEGNVARIAEEMEFFRQLAAPEAPQGLASGRG